MADGFFGGLDKGMKLGIPLALKSMDLDMAKAKLDLETQQHQDELFKEAQEIEKEATEAQQKLAVDDVERTTAVLDSLYEKNAAPELIAEAEEQQVLNLEKAGLPPQIIYRQMEKDEAERELKAELEALEQKEEVKEKVKEPFEKRKEKRAVERKRIEQISKDIREEKKIGQKVRDFETQIYGGPVPKKRGTEEYIQKVEDYRKATGVNITLAGEKFAIKKGVTAGQTRFELHQNKEDKNFYESKVLTYNTLNKRNEVAYWHTRTWDNETKFVKLSPKALRKGWTPVNIQERADTQGKTIEDVLIEIGILK